MINEKKDNSYVVCLLVVLIITVGYFFIKYNKNDVIENKQVVDDTFYENNKEQENSVLDDNSSVYHYDLSKRTLVQSVNEGYIEIIVDTKGRAYLSIIGNLSYEENAQIKRNLSSIENEFAFYYPSGYINEIGTQVLQAYQLNLENVLTVYHVSMGNGGSSYFVFIREDGKLSYLSYEIELINIDTPEKIVSVVENSYSKTPYVIDIYGNEFSLYDYIR